MEKYPSLSLKEKSLINLVHTSNTEYDTFDIADILEIKFGLKVSSKSISFYLRSVGGLKNLKKINEKIPFASFVKLSNIEQKELDKRKKIRSENKSKTIKKDEKPKIKRKTVRPPQKVYMPGDEQPTILNETIFGGDVQKIRCAEKGCQNFVQKYKQSFADTDDHFETFCEQHKPPNKYNPKKIGRW